MNIASQKKLNRLNLKDIYLSAFLLVISFAISCYYIIPGVCGVYHDDGIYLSTAKSIAEGTGYRLINLPESPMQTKYPILYPLLLSMIWKIYPQFPQNIHLMQLMTSMLGSIAICLCYLYFVNLNYCSRYIAFTSCLTCITSSSFQYFSTNLLSEVPFLFLTVLNLWAIDKNAEKDVNSKHFEYFLGIFLALPFLCRTIGIAVIISGLMFFRQRVESIRWLTLGVLSAVLPWVVFSFSAKRDLLINPEIGYYTDYFGWFLNFGPPFLVNVIIINLIHIFNQSVSLAAELFLVLYKSTEYKIILIIWFSLGIIVWGKTIFYRNKANFLKWFLYSYFLAILIWPWAPGRFLIPILPFLIIALYSSIALLLKKALGSKISTLTISIFISVFIITNLYFTNEDANANKNCNYPIMKHSLDRVKWESFEKIFEWIKINTSTEDIIAYGIDPMAYLYTGRKAIRPFVTRPSSLFYGDQYPATGNIKDLCLILDFYKVKYLVQTAMPGFGEEEPFNRLLNEILEQYPDCLKTVYTGDDVRFNVFLVDNQKINELLYRFKIS
jgi:hypothetical protein